MKYLKLFENYTDGIDQEQAKLNDLNSLRDFAIISAAEYKEQSSAILKKITAYNRSLIKQANALHTPYSDEWYQELGQHPSLSWLLDIKSQPEYNEMLAAGLHPASTPVQLGNRTFVFAKSPDYKSGSDYALGLFSSINVVRRLTPDTQRWGRIVKTLDQKVKSFDAEVEPTEFFKAGMRWTLDNLDLTDRGFANKKRVKQDAAQDDERAKLLNYIETIFKDSGIEMDDSIEIIPIDGLRGNMGDLRRLASQIKRSASKPGPLQIPITNWTKYTQDIVDAMSMYPNVEWLIGEHQFVVEAKNTRNWNIKTNAQILQNVQVIHPLAADDILKKLEASGVKQINRLTYPIGQIDLADYNINVIEENSPRGY